MLVEQKVADYRHDSAAVFAEKMNKLKFLKN